MFSPGEMWQIWGGGKSEWICCKTNAGFLLHIFLKIDFGRLSGFFPCSLFSYFLWKIRTGEASCWKWWSFQSVGVPRPPGQSKRLMEKTLEVFLAIFSRRKRVIPVCFFLKQWSIYMQISKECKGGFKKRGMIHMKMGYDFFCVVCVVVYFLKTWREPSANGLGGGFQPRGLGILQIPKTVNPNHQNNLPAFFGKAERRTTPTRTRGSKEYESP